MIVALFQKIAQTHADSIALDDAQQSLTYAELDARSDKMAAYFIEQGVRPSEHIGVFMKRSIDFVITVLAVVKARCVYVPIDPSYPLERIEYLVQDSEIKLAVTSEAVIDPKRVDIFTSRSVKTVEVSQILDSSVEISLIESLLVGSDDSNPVIYLMYTSGSTGLPKGALVPASGIRRLVVNASYVRIQPGDCVAHGSNCSFDASTLEIWGALLNGAKLAILSESDMLSMKELEQSLKKHAVNILVFTPALFNQFAKEGVHFNQIDYLILGGDTLNPQIVKQVIENPNRSPKHLINAYGPTEATVAATAYEVKSVSDSLGPIPMGKAISETQIYVLDEDMNLVEPGSVGEIYIGGSGVAKGYWKRPDLTAERFVSNPFEPCSTDKIYRSGDYARLLPDGNLEFVGRKDNQVKIRGYRIELEELEDRIKTLPQIHEVRVIVHNRRDGRKQLVAYLVLNNNYKGETVSDIRTKVRSALPEHMVPSGFIILDELPVNSNGKIDRKEILKHFQSEGRNQFTRSPFQAQSSVTDVQQKLIEIWGAVLELDGIALEDNFFELGGDSIMALDVASRANARGIHICPKMLFDFPTIGTLDREIHSRGLLNASASCESTVSRSHEAFEGDPLSAYPLSPIQKAFYSYKYHFPESQTYFAQVHWKLGGRFDADCIAKAWANLCERHEILRTTFGHNESGAFYQKPCASADAVLEHHDWRSTADDEQHAQIEQFLYSDRQRPIDLGDAGAYRLSIARLKEEESLFVFSFHHILMDGWSVYRLIHDFLDAYNRLLNEKPLLAEHSPSYRQYVEWLEGRDTCEAKKFWKAYLKDFQGTNLLDASAKSLEKFDSNRDPETSHKSEKVVLDETLSSKLREGARGMKVTLNTIIQAAWSYLLSTYSNEKDVAFGVVVALREFSLKRSDEIIGNLINCVPLRVSVDRDKTVSGFCNEVQTCMSQIAEHSFLSLNEIQHCSQISGDKNLFESLISFENFPLDTMEQDSCRVHSVQEVEDTEHALTLLVMPGEKIKFQLMYKGGLYSQEAASSMLEAFVHVCEQFAESGLGTAVGDLSLVSGSEESKILKRGRGEDIDRQGEGLLEAILKNADAHPDHTAIHFEGVDISYGQLASYSNNLAARLASEGVKQGDRVVIFFERSPEVIASMLACMRLGATYIPLSPEFPKERIEYVLKDAEPKLVVTQEYLLGGIPSSASNTLLVDAVHGSSQEQSEAPILPQYDPEGIIYIMYTSGSTGAPKGVKVKNKGVFNYAKWLQERHGLSTSDTLMHQTAFTFDMSVIEIFGSLVSGSTIAIVRQGEEKMPSRLVQTIKDQSVTLINVVPATLRALISEGLFQGEHTIQQIICGADVLKYDLLKTFHEQTSIPLFNYYGPTECSVYSTYWKATELKGSKVVPIGGPVANTQLYILDEKKQLVPQGVAGELHIGGEGVAEGYVNAPELTRSKFFYSERFNNTLYATGDLVKQLEDGNLVFISRNDSQVKLNGHRIELEEIDFQLCQHPQVGESCTIIRGDEDSGRQVLASYIVSKDKSVVIDEGEFRSLLEPKLPEYMIPKVFVQLDALPLNSNSKVDRKVLASLKSTSKQRASEGGEALSPVEQQLICVFKDLLKLEEGEVTREDNFFDIGGDSLSAIELSLKIQSLFDISFDSRSLFANPTVHKLANFIERSIEKKVFEKSTVCSDQQGGEDSEWDFIVPLKHDSELDGKPSLFLIHPIGGTVFCFMSLAGYLKGFNIYGIEDPDMKLKKNRFSSIEELGAYYLEGIRRIQPKGPYYFCGFSFGATMALEMAKQLEEEGETIKFIGLLDGWAYYPRDLKEQEVFAAMMQDQYDRLRDQMEGINMGDSNPWLQLQQERGDMHEKYEFKTVRSPITLFKASELLPMFEKIDHPKNYCSRLSEHSVKVIPCGGDHLTMLDKQHAAKLASAIQAEIGFTNKWEYGANRLFPVQKKILKGLLYRMQFN